MKNCSLASPRVGGEEAFSHSARLGRRASALIWAAALWALVFPGVLAAQPSQIVSNLDAGELSTALRAGGTVAFAIDGTIVLTNTITISTNVILDGNGHSITISGGGAVELFNLPAGLNLTLRNLTLADGVSNGSAAFYTGEYWPNSGNGGAIFSQGNLDVEECVFSNNLATMTSSEQVIGVESDESGLGGAIYNAGWLTITNSVFANNSAIGGSPYDLGHTSFAGGGFGGAIYNSGGTINLSHVVFSNNAAIGGTGVRAIYGGYAGEGCGGAIFSAGGVIVADRIEVVNNTTAGGGYSFQGYSFGSESAGSALGGAPYLTGGTIAASNSSFSNNSTSGASAGGGAAGQSQGGCVFNAGFALFSDCSFTGSTANGALGEDFYGAASDASPGLGGAIYNVGNLRIQRGNIISNTAIGGTIDTDVPIIPADGMGGAIYNMGSLEIEGSILSLNSAVGPNGFNLYLGAAIGNGRGGAIYSTGFVVLTGASLSSNFTIGQINFGEAIYSTGVIQSDTNTTLTPCVIGTPPLAYQWQLNGNNLAGATNSPFNLGNVQFSNLGTYDLVISNATGLVTNFEEIVNQPPPPLTISGVTPDTGLTLGGASVTITGAGFANGATVSFGNAAATSVTVVSATSITATTPPSAIPGPVDVVVTNADFQPVVLTNGFAYVAPVFISAPRQGAPPATGNINAFIFTVGGAGMPGCNFVIECSTNLVNWQPLQTNPTPFTFTDTNAANDPLRFYRAVLAY